MAERDRIIRITEKSQQSLLRYMVEAHRQQDTFYNNQDRFLEIDRAYLRESDKTDSQQKARLANRVGDTNKLQNVEIPMVLEAVENTVGFLTNVYLVTYPIYKFGSPSGQDDVALMWNTLVSEDQRHYGWTAELNKAFRNGEKYNFAPIEVEWCREHLYAIAPGSAANGTALKQVIREGNKISSKNPYNTFYDRSVEPSEVHIKGEFGGYVEVINRVQLKKLLASLGDRRLPNDKAAIESAPGDISYFYPDINESVLDRKKQNTGENFDWPAWMSDSAKRHMKYRAAYTKTVMYARIMPFDFGISAPKDQTPDIWKLIAINNVLIYAEPMDNAHDYLPLIIVEPNSDNLGIQTKTSAENQLPFQHVASGLWNAEMNLARRASTDRMLYNPLLIDPEHINSPNPSAKIPLRPTAYGRKLEEAVYKIPFDHGNAGLYMQAANGVSEWALRAGGQNRTSIGQYQPGNKLESEFNRTMQNAGARDRTKAIMWETLGMHPIKTILKYNYQQYAPQGKIYNTVEQKEVEVDIIKLRTSAGEFVVGDGLLPVEKLLNADIGREAFQVLSTNPQIGKDYRTGDMFVHLMKLQGVADLDKYKIDPEIVAYQGAIATWTAQAMELAKSKPSITVEEFQKLVEVVIGPKPEVPEKLQPKPAQNPLQPNAQGT